MGFTSLQKWVKAMRSLSHNKEVEQFELFLDKTMNVLIFEAADPSTRQLTFRDPSQKVIDDMATAQNKLAFLTPFPQDLMFVG